MADVWATKNGNWSDVTVWNTGALPTTADDVYADGRIVYIDINTQVLSISNGIRPGGTVNGYFIGNNGVSLSANVLCRDGSGGSVIACLELLSAAPSTFTVFGNVVGATASNGRAIRCTSSGTLTVFGNVSGGTGSGNAWGIDNQSTGIVNIIGDVRAVNVLNAGAILNSSTGTVNVTGNVFGSSTGSNNRGINNSGNGLVNVRGDIIATTGTGNHGILNNAGGTVTIVGNVSGGSTSTVGNGSTGTINLTGDVAGVTGTGISNTSSGTVNILGNLIAAAGSAVGNSSTGNVNVVGTLRGGTATAAAGITNSGSGTLTFVGSVTGGSTTNAHGISQSLGTVNLTGTIIGGTGGDCAGLTNNSSNAATVTNIFGNVFGGTGGLGAYMFGSSGTINVYGNVFGTTNRGMQVGGSAPSGSVNIFGSVFAINIQGVLNTSTTGVVTIMGDVFGGNVTNAYGVQNGLATSVTIVSGRAVGGIGSAAYGAFNNSTGILRVRRAVGNEWGLGYTTAVASVPGVFSNVQGSQTFVQELELGPRGQWPTGGVIFFTPNTRATSMFETDTFQPYTLIQSNSADNLLPPVSSVRQGITYNLGLNTGTCIIPPVSSVAAGTLVDNLTGIGVLTPQTTWNYPTTASDINSMGGRLRNALNSDSAEKLINSFSS